MIRFTAHLSALSPNYREWRSIFDQDEIPLKAPIPIKGQTAGQAGLFYEIDHRRLSIPELEKLLQVIANALRSNVSAAIQYLNMRGGYAIPREDVIVVPHPEDLDELRKEND
jgi:hypothetical protein